MKTNPGALTPGELRFVRAEMRRGQPEKQTQGYGAHVARIGRDQAAQSARGRDIGRCPDIKDIPRREACALSLEESCRVYNPGTFYLPFSGNQRFGILRLEESARTGAMYAWAMDRGGGKTTLCRGAAVWALANNLCRFLFLIGANEGKATQNLEALKKWLLLPQFAADYPDVAYCFKRLDWKAQLCKGQISNGIPTLVQWSSDRLGCGMVEPPRNWPDHWPTRTVTIENPDGTADTRTIVPTAESVVLCAGLTADGIRGSNLMSSLGDSLRPDFVLCDDPQTPESARSPTQTEFRRQLITSDIMGMAGPDRTMSLVIPCTVIQPGDLTDTLLDRTKYPLLRGERMGVLKSMPKDLGAWDRYFTIYAECAQTEPPNFERSNAHYFEHQAELDEGAEASWPERVKPPAVTAVQSAMHWYFDDPRAFWAEGMNSPLALYDPEQDYPKLTPDDIMGRINNHKRGLVPSWATTLTAGIDLGQKLLHYAVVAWGNGFQGAVVDYGVWPKQGRLYFASRDANPTIGAETGIGTVEGSLRKALDTLAVEILARQWEQRDGSPMRLQRALVDYGWKMDVAFRFCQESAHAAILSPSKGLPITAAKASIGEWAKRQGERREPGPDPRWMIRAGKGRAVMFDSGAFKSFVYDRLLVPKGETSALMLFGDRESEHRLFADHLTAEYRVKTVGRGRTVDAWLPKPGEPDNHWFDSLVMAACAASVCGVTLETNAPKPPERRRVSAADAQRKRQEFESRRMA